MFSEYLTPLTQKIQDRILRSQWPSSYLLSLSLNKGGGLLSQEITTALLCLHKEKVSCGECRSCVMIKHGTHPDRLSVQCDLALSARS